MNIRKASLSDLDKINNLVFQETNNYAQSRPDVNVAVADLYSAEMLQKMIEDENSCVLCAELNSDDEVVAMLVASKQNTAKSRTKTKRTLAYIGGIVIDETYRKRGIATELFEYFKQSDFVADCDAIELMVHADNDAAVAFYEKLGMTANIIRYEMKFDKTDGFRLKAKEKTIKVSEFSR